MTQVVIKPSTWTFGQIGWFEKLSGVAISSLGDGGKIGDAMTAMAFVQMAGPEAAVRRKDDPALWREAALLTQDEVEVDMTEEDPTKGEQTK